MVAVAQVRASASVACDPLAPFRRLQSRGRFGRGHPAVCELLLEAKSDTTVRNGLGHTVLDIARHEGLSNDVVSLLEDYSERPGRDFFRFPAKNEDGTTLV